MIDTTTDYVPKVGDLVICSPRGLEYYAADARSGMGVAKVVSLPDDGESVFVICTQDHDGCEKELTRRNDLDVHSLWTWCVQPYEIVIEED